MVGTVKDCANQVMGSTAADADARMQAVATNGTILAESSVYAASSGSIGRNFRLEVPLTAAATTRSAVVGDAVRLVLSRNGTASAVSSAPIVLSGACVETNVTLQLYATYSYTNKTTGAVATLPRDYVDSLASWLDGIAYDPFADADGDGASNYMEYLAATDPFNASDKLAIRDFRHDGARVAIKFEYAGGVIYAVRSSPSLDSAKAAWADESVATDEAAAPAQKQILIDANAAGDPGEATLYMLPTEGVSSMFYKLEVK